MLISNGTILDLNRVPDELGREDATSRGSRHEHAAAKALASRELSRKSAAARWQKYARSVSIGVRHAIFNVKHELIFAEVVEAVLALESSRGADDLLELLERFDFLLELLLLLLHLDNLARQVTIHLE